MKRRITPFPYVKKIPKTLEYLHRNDMESTYTTPRGTSETSKSYKRRLYTSHLTIIRATAGHPEMRAEKLRPNIDRAQTSKNLNEVPVPETTRGVWYRVIHEIIPTNERLHRITMVQTVTCRKRAWKETSRPPSTSLWWRKIDMGLFKNPNSEDIKDDSASDTWRLDNTPSISHMASQETLAKVIIFRLQQKTNLTLQDYMDLLQRSTSTKNKFDSARLHGLAAKIYFNNKQIWLSKTTWTCCKDLLQQQTNLTLQDYMDLLQRSTSTKNKFDWARLHGLAAKIYFTNKQIWLCKTTSTCCKDLLHQQTNLTLQDYMDFLQRSRWKLMSQKKGRELSGITSRSWKREGKSPPMITEVLW